MGSRDGGPHQWCAYHEWNDPVGDEFVDKVRVVFDPLGVGGVITTTQWDDAWPRDGEPVSLHAILAQQGDVVLPTFVRVGGNISVLSIEGLAGRPSEVIPDGLATAADVRGTLDLEGSWSCRNTVG